MAKSEKQKLKLLYLRDFLRQNTDEAHPASVQRLIDYLASKDVRAERKSIYDDIRALNEYGIEVLYRRGSDGGYYVSQRDFELPELKLLVDAVLSSRFLSPKRSAELIRKIAALSGEHGSELLRRDVVLAGRLKTTAEDGFANVDAIHEAIRKNSRIAFRYFDWGTNLKKKYREGEYDASPYFLLWDDENYYLIAHTEKHGLTHYRVDKMESIRLTGEKRVFTEETKKLDPAAYARESFGMYRGERKRIKLRFENALAGVVVDRFGRDILPIPDGKEHFTLTVDVSVSPNFLGWIAGFGGRAAILFPQSVVDEYHDLCRAALNT